jgi:HlyD family secretion protein
VLARLDPSSYDAQLRQEQAALAQAEADAAGFRTALADAQTKLTRAEELSARSLIPASALDAARIAAESATADLRAGESQIQRARAMVHEATVNLEHTVITSPIAGIVVERSVDVGQSLAASVQSPVLFRIAADLRRMQLQTDIDESDIGGIATGEVARFQVESYADETFQGIVSEIRLQPTSTASTGATTGAAPAGAAGTIVTYTTIVDVANPDERLRPGMTATVTLEGFHREDAVRIPNLALAFRPPADVLTAIGETETPIEQATTDDTASRVRHVWRYDGSRFSAIAVRTGLGDGEWTELVDGRVHAGDRLVVKAQALR